MSELAQRLEKLEALEYELGEHRKRLRGVRRRLLFVFLPLLLVALSGMETPFRVQIVAVIIGASLFDSLVHYWRVRTLERRREGLLAEGESGWGGSIEGGHSPDEVPTKIEAASSDVEEG